MKKLIFATVILSLLLPLAACGKKPGFVDPPVDDQGKSLPSDYPKTYPKPWL